MKRRSVLLAILLLLVMTSTSDGQINKKKAARRVEIPPIAIYDAYKVIPVNTEVVERPTILNKLEPVGERKARSKLKSTASIAECKTPWTTEILKRIKSGSLANDNDDQEPGAWQIIKSVHSLAATACAIVDYNNYVIRVIDFNIDVELADEKYLPYKLLWISKLQKGNDRSDEIIFAEVSIESSYDARRHVKVAAIADINNDGFHDIIVDDVRYAGSSYVILYFTGKGFVEQKEIAGASWD